jgi:hypothetical protein
MKEEEEMSLKRKQMQMRQKAFFEQALQNRMAFLSEKGVESRKADKDPLARKIKADIKAVNSRLKLVADNEKITEEMAKIKADRAAAPRKEQESVKTEKPKKAPEEGKGKKIKPEKKATPPNAQEGGHGQKEAGAPEEGKPKV